ncbi:MAG: hypothetical protein ACK55I_26015, partial [bacterium]
PGPEHAVGKRVDRAERKGIVEMALRVTGRTQHRLHPSLRVTRLRIIGAQRQGTLDPRQSTFQVPLQDEGAPAGQKPEGIQGIALQALLRVTFREAHRTVRVGA